MDPGDTISIPELAIRPRRLGCGLIHHVLRPAGTRTVMAVHEVRVSPRRTAPLVELDDGEKVVVTTLPRVECPQAADGVLHRSDLRQPWRWTHHRLLDEVDGNLLTAGPTGLAQRIAEDWPSQFRPRIAEQLADGSRRPGFRRPQFAALHAITAHWAMERGVATVVMPTGTGKTETMLGAIAGYGKGTFLVVVPSDALRRQTLRRFRTFGLLKDPNMIDALAPAARLPVVGLVQRRPKVAEDLDFIASCNVAIATVSSIAQGTATALLGRLAELCSHLIVDEAHHVRASTWETLRRAFKGKPVLQFTATPFRRDGREVDGRIIFNYPLAQAQRDGYFKPIHFVGLSAGGARQADAQIADKAVERLKEDLSTGRDHLLMARCATIDRAQEVLQLYQIRAPELRPAMVHSKLPETTVDGVLAAFRHRACRIVVCVDMLGEGFDLPQLKIAALHDIHKSLAILMQFTGRFTRVGDDSIGDATVIANIDNLDLPEALERLYSEDPDWNELLADYSFEAIQEQQLLLDFLRNAERLDPPDPEAPVPLSSNMFRPIYSTVVYRCPEFHPRRFQRALPHGASVKGVWLHQRLRVLLLVTLTQTAVRWARSKKVVDTTWELYVVHHSEDLKLLFIHSSNKRTQHQELARAVGGDEVRLVRGETVFRCFAHINRLVLLTVGLKSRGRRKLSYSMFSGSDVTAALSPSQTTRSERTNFFGAGYEDGQKTNIGCSYKGRIWTRELGSLHGFASWCRHIGTKLLDDSITTDGILANALIPMVVTHLPDKAVLSIEWPTELTSQPEHFIGFTTATGGAKLSEWSIELGEYDQATDSFAFALVHDHQVIRYRLTITPDSTAGFTVVREAGAPVQVSIGRSTEDDETFFGECPPSLLFVDGSELEGSLLYEPKDWTPPPIPAERMVSWDWAGTDITKESMWKDGCHRADSIQHRAAQELVAKGYEVVFDDDGAGEAADLVGIRELSEVVEVTLVHCKYSGGNLPGQRVKDVVEVCSQAVRSVRWSERFRDLVRHVRARADLLPQGRASRFITGDSPALTRLLKTAKTKPVAMRVVAIQPGLQKSAATEAQLTVLSAAHGYLLETAGVGLDVVCSP